MTTPTAFEPAPSAETRSGAGVPAWRARPGPRAWVWAAMGWTLLSAFSPASAAADTQPAALLEQYSAQAGQPPSLERGRLFFRSRQGGSATCASCHGATPVTAGEHSSTGKRLEPLAPAANPRAFTDSARVEKWFRRNCQDVAGRPCTPVEKADVLAWLITLRP